MSSKVSYWALRAQLTFLQKSMFWAKTPDFLPSQAQLLFNHEIIQPLTHLSLSIPT